MFAVRERLLKGAWAAATTSCAIENYILTIDVARSESLRYLSTAGLLKLDSVGLGPLSHMLLFPNLQVF